MMTKDKKPFTYTPGGIDLSEVRSPRMARRIERNANLGGVDQVPRPQQTQPVGPLPPSALAAMQPQLQVQVFPSPPPPPPPCAPPPPPPPPTQPLPMQKCMTADNQVVERPDMTKIIPENPMALLRKSPGPTRKSFIEEVDNFKDQPAPQPTFMQKPQPQPAPNRRSFVDEVDNFEQPVQTQFVKPPPIEARPYVKSNVPNRRSFVDEVDSFVPPQQQVRPPPQQPQPFVQKVQSPPIAKPDPYQQPQPQVKTSSVNVGSLYIPPVNSQPQENVIRVGQVASPPTPPERQTPKVQSPPTPTLNKAPRPWQTQKPQQQDLPPWAIREPRSPQESSPQPQLVEQQSPPVRQTNVPPQPRVIQVQQPGPSVNAQPQQRNIPVQPQASNNQAPRGANVVWVTQPQVLQHPGGGVGPAPNQRNFQRPQNVPQQTFQNVQNSHQQAPQPKANSQGVRIIPIQIETTNNVNQTTVQNKFNQQKPTTPVTPGNER